MIDFVNFHIYPLFQQKYPYKGKLTRKMKGIYKVLERDEGIKMHLKCKYLKTNAKQSTFAVLMHPNGAFEILVENGTPVEFGQVLMRVKPA